MAKYNIYKEVDKDAPIWAKRIAAIMNTTNMTQDELASKTGVSSSTLTGWLKNGTEPKISGFLCVAKALNVSVDYLLGLTDVQSLDTDLKAVCDFTGLSEQSVITIKEIVGMATLPAKPICPLSSTEKIFNSTMDVFNGLFEENQAVDFLLLLDAIQNVADLTGYQLTNRSNEQTDRKKYVTEMADNNRITIPIATATQLYEEVAISYFRRIMRRTMYCEEG